MDDKLVIQDHRIAGVSFRSSPNFNERPQGVTPDLIVIHNISLPPGIFTGMAVIDFFLNRLDWNSHKYYRQIKGTKVSPHVFIRRDGEIIQFVPFDKSAWHAGKSSFNGRENCNDFSIGIELEGMDEVIYPDEQYASLAKVCKPLQEEYGISSIAGHGDIAPGRKTDPGEAFDWHRFNKLLQ